MIFKLFLVIAFFVCSLLPGFSLAQNKVVVIPLMEDAPPPDPYAPLTAESPPSAAYTDNGNGTVTDNVTGLVWQKSDDNTTRTWEEAWDYCAGNDAGLPGTGWRLPSKGELLSIVYYGTYVPAINGTAFPGTNSTYYWSSATNASFSGSARYVSFSYGLVDISSKSNYFYVRCVRGKFIRDHIFKNNGNGTVTDLATGLTWQQIDDNDTKTWVEANTYCNGLDLAGGGWRLPNVKELESIVDDRVYNLAIDTDVFPGTNSSFYWSSTASAVGSGGAWSVHCNDGYVNGYDKSYSYYVRCVR